MKTKTQEQINSKVERLWVKAMKHVKEWDGTVHYEPKVPFPVKWSSKGSRIIRRMERLQDKLI